MEKRYCDSCGTSKNYPRWYYSQELDEVCLCGPCFKVLSREVDDLEKMTV